MPRPRLTGTPRGIIRLLKEAGISPNTYYPRRYAGDTHEEAMAKGPGLPRAKRKPRPNVGALLASWDPTPWCHVCGAMTRPACSCPDPFYCDNH